MIRSTGVATRNVHIVLLELDLAGRLQRHGQRPPSAAIGFFAVGLFERHIDQIGEERHLGAVGDQSQPFKPPGGSAPAHRWMGLHCLLEAGLRTLPFHSALFRADQSPGPPPNR